MHQAVVEVGTDICSSVDEARGDILHLRKTIKTIANSMGYGVGAAGTHPFSTWRKQLITDNIRYQAIVNEMQDAARSNLIFGLHVHVGMPSREMAIHIANSARYFLPHVFALSTNSPFWEGRDTGFKSYRTKVFDKFPRTGIPEYFDSYSAYENYVNLLIKTNCIDNAKKKYGGICGFIHFMVQLNSEFVMYPSLLTRQLDWQHFFNVSASNYSSSERPI